MRARFTTRPNALQSDALVGRIAELGSLGVIVRHFATYGLLTLIGLCLMTSTGCNCSKTSNAIADVLVATIVAPQLELSVSTMAFQREHGRWPCDYAELRSFTASQTRPALTNYDRVDFTQQADGSLEIYAVAPSMTNQMTLRLTEESQK